MRPVGWIGCWRGRQPAWEVTREDIDRVVGAWAADGIAASTRRGYVQSFKGFHRFLLARKAAEIEAAFGVRLVCPVDEFNASRHVGDDSPATMPPPTPERMEEFFEFLETRIATARKYGPAARDYALFRTLYHAGAARRGGRRCWSEPTCISAAARSASCTSASARVPRRPGPRPRWVPMLDGLDLVLRWFLDDVRGRFPDSPALFCDEGGGRLHRGTIRNRLRYLMELEGRPEPSGSVRTRCAGPARPTTTSVASIWSRSSRCSATGRSDRRCGTSGRRRRSSRTPIAERCQTR